MTWLAFLCFAGALAASGLWVTVDRELDNPSWMRGLWIAAVIVFVLVPDNDRIVAPVGCGVVLGLLVAWLTPLVIERHRNRH